MESNLFLYAPNLIGDIYRSQTFKQTGKFHRSYDFIDVNQDGIFILGTSDLCGRYWPGSVWIFDDISAVPDENRCLGNMDFDEGVSTGKWFNGGVNIAVGSDSGSLSILSLCSLIDMEKPYLSLNCVISDHDDGITSLDVSFDSTTMVTGSRDQSIKLVNVEEVVVEQGYDYAHNQAVNSVCFMPGQSNIFISASADGDSLLWDTRQEKSASSLLYTETGFTASTWIDDNYAVFGANTGLLHLVDVRTKLEVDQALCSNRPIHYVNLEKSSQLLAVCADDPMVRAYDCSRKNFCEIYEAAKHEHFVRGLCWRSRNNLYSCGRQRSLAFHDISRGDNGSTTKIEMEDCCEFELFDRK